MKPKPLFGKCDARRETRELDVDSFDEERFFKSSGAIFRQMRINRIHASHLDVYGGYDEARIVTSNTRQEIASCQHW
jgi:hypothetical protein